MIPPERARRWPRRCDGASEGLGGSGLRQAGGSVAGIGIIELPQASTSRVWPIRACRRRALLLDLHPVAAARSYSAALAWIST
jgi:hypothetical protein